MKKLFTTIILIFMMRVATTKYSLHFRARKYVEYSSLVCLTWLWINFSSADSSRLCIQNPEPVRNKVWSSTDEMSQHSATYWDRAETSRIHKLMWGTWDWLLLVLDQGSNPSKLNPLHTGYWDTTKLLHAYWTLIFISNDCPISNG